MNTEIDSLFARVFVSDEADCVRHAIREVATRFDIRTTEAAAMIAEMYGLNVVSRQTEIEQAAAELGIELLPTPLHSQRA